MNVRRLLRTRSFLFAGLLAAVLLIAKHHSASGVRLARQLGREPDRVRTIRDPRDREHAGRAHRSGRDRPLDRAACEPGQRRPHRVHPSVDDIRPRVARDPDRAGAEHRRRPVQRLPCRCLSLPAGHRHPRCPDRPARREPEDHAGPAPSHRGVGRGDAGRSRPDPVGSDPDRASARRMGRAPADAVPPDALLRRRQCGDGVLRRCQRDIGPASSPTRSAACSPASGGLH